MSAREETTHRCAWPHCAAHVPADVFMCRQHWFMLTPYLRDDINRGAHGRGDLRAAQHAAIEWARRQAGDEPAPETAPPSGDLFPDAEITIPPRYSITDRVRCLRRELRYRQQVFPRRVSAGKMKRDDARKELMLIAQILHEYEAQTDDFFRRVIPEGL